MWQSQKREDDDESDHNSHIHFISEGSPRTRPRPDIRLPEVSFAASDHDIFASFDKQHESGNNVGSDHSGSVDTPSDDEKCGAPSANGAPAGSIKRHKCTPDCTTELIEAAKRRSGEKVRELLDEGSNPNARDCKGRTPLHYAVKGDCSCESCISNAVNCVRLLVDCPRSDINLQDSNGDTALHLAAENQATKCASLLIYSGADVSIKSKNGVRALKLMVDKVPEAMESLLNRAISIDKYDPWNLKCELKVDFGAIVGYDSKGMNRNSGKAFLPEPDPIPKYRKETQLLTLILDANSSSRKKILTHPLIAVFLYLKWRCVRPVFWTMTAIHIVLLILYTLYILDVYLISCPYRPKITEPAAVKAAKAAGEGFMTKENETYRAEYIKFSWFQFSPQLNLQEIQLGITECHLEIGPTVKSVLLLGVTLVMTFNEIFRMLPGPRAYLKSSSNRFQWIYFFFIYVTAWPVFMETPSISFWQYQAAAFGLFLSWAIMLFQIGKFPKLGLYVEILTQVLQNFGFFMVTYMSLVIAFALAFCVLFPGNAPYASIPLSILKVLMMMVGEVNYEDLFYGSEESTVDDLLYPITGHILYGAFVIMITIVLMNLLVGLTVSDIQGLQRNAELTRLSRQISEISQVESFVMSRRVQSLFPGKIGSFLRESLLVVPSNKLTQSNPLAENWFFRVRPNDPQDKTLPEHLKISLVRIAGMMQKSISSNTCKSMYNILKDPSTAKPPPTPVTEEFPPWIQPDRRPPYPSMGLNFGSGLERSKFEQKMAMVSGFGMGGPPQIDYFLRRLEEKIMDRMKIQMDALYQKIEEKITEIK